VLIICLDKEVGRQILKSFVATLEMHPELWSSCPFHLLVVFLSIYFWHILLSFSLQVKSFYTFVHLTKFLLIIFVVEESQSSVSTSSGLASKSAYIPRRLVIGNDEYAHSYFSVFHILCDKFHHCWLSCFTSCLDETR